MREACKFRNSMCFTLQEPTHTVKLNFQHCRQTKLEARVHIRRVERCSSETEWESGRERVKAWEVLSCIMCRGAIIALLLLGSPAAWNKPIAFQKCFMSFALAHAKAQATLCCLAAVLYYSEHHEAVFNVSLYCLIILARWISWVSCLRGCYIKLFTYTYTVFKVRGFIGSFVCWI